MYKERATFEEKGKILKQLCSKLPQEVLTRWAIMQEMAERGETSSRECHEYFLNIMAEYDLDAFAQYGLWLQKEAPDAKDERAYFRKLRAQVKKQELEFKRMKSGFNVTKVSRPEWDKIKGSSGEQLDFIALFQLPEKDKWTRAFLKWDSLPKFFFKDTKKLTNAVDPSESQTFDCSIEGQNYFVTLNPAQVSDAKVPFFAYPGEREELVSRALRYLAVQRGALVSAKDSQVRVVFTLRQLAEVLSNTGHTYSHEEIDEALMILRNTRLTVKASANDRKAFIITNLLEHYAGLDTPEGQKREVYLSKEESSAIIQGNFRGLNYARLMHLKSPLARKIYEHVVSRHTGASKPPVDPNEAPPRPYEIKLSTILREFGIEPQKRMRQTIERVRNALQELVEEGILWKAKPFEEIQEYPPKVPGRKGRLAPVDILWKLYLSAEDVQDVIAANMEAKSNDLFSNSSKEAKLTARKNARSALRS